MITTERLVLRNWQEDDHQGFIDLNADHQVMEFFPDVYPPDESLDFIEFCRSSISERSWGFWAVEERISGSFIGMVGLNKIPEDIPVMQSHEVGWRLATPFWGKGYATEAAIASLEFGFSTLALEQIVAFTPIHNLRSRRVMEKLNMKLLADTFEHPRVAEGSNLREHVLYEIQKDHFM